MRERALRRIFNHELADCVHGLSQETSTMKRFGIRGVLLKELTQTMKHCLYRIRLVAT
jgi:hypothetical protein